MESLTIDPDTADPFEGAPDPEPSLPDWECAECGHSNDYWARVCWKCGEWPDDGWLGDSNADGLEY